MRYGTDVGIPAAPMISRCSMLSNKLVVKKWMGSGQKESASGGESEIVAGDFCKPDNREPRGYLNRISELKLLSRIRTGGSCSREGE